MLVARTKPAWAKRRYFLLATVFGLSPMLRQRLSEESQETTFQVVKLVTKIECPKLPK